MRWILVCLLTLILIGCSTTEQLPTTSTTLDASVSTVAVDVFRDGDEYIELDLCGTAGGTVLKAGKHHNAGMITVNTTIDKLVIIVTAYPDWYIGTTHLHVGKVIREEGEEEVEDIVVDEKDLRMIFPLNRPGNPKVGHFIYSEEGELTKHILYTIDLEDLNNAAPDDLLLIAFHAEVVPNMDNDADYDERVFELNKEMDGEHDLSRESAWGEGSLFPGRSWAMYFPYVVTTCDEEDELLE